jgi:hypothetical protein
MQRGPLAWGAVDRFTTVSSTGAELGYIASIRQIAKPDFAVRQHNDKGVQEGGGGMDIGTFPKTSESEFGYSIDGNEEPKLPSASLGFGKIDVKIADGIRFERLLRWLVTVDINQAIDAMAPADPLRIVFSSDAD